MSLGRYDYHARLISYREGDAIQRLSALRSELQTTTGVFCGYSEIMRLNLDKIPIAAPRLSELQNQLSMLCTTLRELLSTTKPKAEFYTVEEAEQALKVYWEKFGVAKSALSIPDNIRLFAHEARRVLPNYDFSLDHIEDQLLLTWAVFDMLANPGESSLPRDIYDLAVALRSMQDKITSGDNRVFPLLVEASQHEMSYFRKDAALLLRHYKTDEAADILIHLLGDPTEEVVAEASNSLKHLKNRKAIPTLIECLERKFEAMAYIGWIASALAAMPDERALEPLIRKTEEVLQNLEQNRDFFYPAGGLFEALQAIGGARAEEILRRYSR